MAVPVPDLGLPAVVAAVIVQDGRVLLVRRRATEPGLVRTFPGGKIKTVSPPRLQPSARR